MIFGFILSKLLYQTALYFGGRGGCLRSSPFLDESDTKLQHAGSATMSSCSSVDCLIVLMQTNRCITIENAYDILGLPGHNQAKNPQIKVRSVLPYASETGRTNQKIESWPNLPPSSRLGTRGFPGRVLRDDGYVKCLKFTRNSIKTSYSWYAGINVQYCEEVKQRQWRWLSHVLQRNKTGINMLQHVLHISDGLFNEQKKCLDSF